eukprot:g9890.t1 g9890   contig4:807606-810547(+)
MPPTKRKAEVEEGSATTPTKKSKIEIRAEAKERARQYAESLKAKKAGVAVAAPFSAGKASASKKSTTAAGAKRQRAVAKSPREASLPMMNLLPNARVANQWQQQQRRRQMPHYQSASAGATASSSSAAAAGSSSSRPSPAYQFGGANRRGDERRDVDEDEEMEDQDVAVKHTMSPDEKKKALDRARAYSEKLRMQKGGAPAARESAQPPPATAAASATTSAQSTTNAQKPSFQPPASVADIFSPKKRTNEQHRPSASVATAHPPIGFDPTQPWPPVGHRLPTAAYCGCGPTPGSRTARSDLCATTTDVIGGGGGGSSRFRESMKGVPPVDPPHGSYAFGEKEDYERKMPAIVRPCPPGSVGVPRNRKDGGGGGNQIYLPVPVNDNTFDAAAAAPKPNEGILHAIARANALVSTATSFNRRRRANMGIHSEGTPSSTVGNGKEKSVEVIKTQQLRTNVHFSVDPPVDSTTDDSKTAETMQEAEHAGKEEIVVESTVEEGHATNAKLNSLLQKIVGKIVTGVKYLMFAQLILGFLYLSTHKYIGEPITTLTVDDKRMRLWPSFLKPLNVAHTIEEIVDAKSEAEAKREVSCFIDHPSDFYFSGEDLDGDSICGGKYKECPLWGRCHGGILRDCNDGGGEFEGLQRFVPSQKGDGCVPSIASLDLVRVVQDTLFSMTASQKCHSSDRLGHHDVHLEEPFPLFRITKVAERVNGMAGSNSTVGGIDVSPELLSWLSPVFDSSIVRHGSLSSRSEGRIDAIGLAPEVSPNSLPLTVACTAKIISWEMIEFFGNFTTSVLGIVAKFLWDFMFNNPIPSFVALTLIMIAYCIRRELQHKAKVREFLRVVLDAVYDRLAECDDNEGYASLMLRDDVGHDMYPTNVRERNFVYNDVWPRVVLEVRADNRVQKFRKEAGGKSLEHWQFHLQPKRGRRLRKSFGSTPSKDSGVSSVKDAAPQQRDP